jgi:hypothetical protein
LYREKAMKITCSLENWKKLNCKSLPIYGLFLMSGSRMDNAQQCDRMPSYKILE